MCQSGICVERLSKDVINLSHDNFTRSSSCVRAFKFQLVYSNCGDVPSSNCLTFYFAACWVLTVKSTNTIKKPK